MNPINTIVWTIAFLIPAALASYVQAHPRTTPMPREQAQFISHTLLVGDCLIDITGLDAGAKYRENGISWPRMYEILDGYNSAYGREIRTVVVWGGLSHCRTDHARQWTQKIRSLVSSKWPDAELILLTPDDMCRALDLFHCERHLSKEAVYWLQEQPQYSSTKKLVYSHP